MAIESVTQEALRSAAPILLATLGAIIGQRAGVLNLGLEGVIYLSAAVAAVLGPPWGIAAAILVGTLYNLLYYFLTNDMAMNQILLGIAFTMIGYGAGSQIAQPVAGMPIERPIYIRAEAFAMAALLAVYLHIILTRMKIGMAIRASGDDPPSLDLMGVDVYWVRKIAGLLEGALVSAAGAYLSIFYFGTWAESLIIGWGSLAVITAMISLWSPLFAIVASIIPSTFIVLAYVLQQYVQISTHLLNIIPYAAPVVVLTLLHIVKRSGMRTVAPRWLARPYVREERS
ncbi:MAG: ABC transporter permease [Pyrobaculum sp.]